MKKLIIINVILLLSFNSIGQESKFSIGVFSSIGRHNFDFKRTAGFYHNYELNLSYSVGLNVKWNLSERFFTKGAIQYSQIGYKLEYDFNLIEPGDPLIPRETTIDIYYFGIPIYLGYDLYNGDKFIIAPSAGLVNEFIIGDNETSIFEDNSERDSKLLNQNLNKYLISSQINLAFEYHLSDKLFVNLEPFLRIGFTSIDDEMVESNTFSYGGILSINYKLK